MNKQEIELAVLAQEIKLTLSVREVNGILAILGKYPFDEVQTLVNNIQTQGQPQVEAAIDIINKANAGVAGEVPVAMEEVAPVESAPVDEKPVDEKPANEPVVG